MNIDDKYLEAFKKMECLISDRKKEQKLTALGYTSNLDILCDFQTEQLNLLLEEYLPEADLLEMRPAELIQTMTDFLETVVYFCIQGIGGEVDIADFQIIRGKFKEQNGMGGTATQGAMALAAVECPSVVHLTDDSKEVCDILDSSYIYSISKDQELIHTGNMVQERQQEIHYIIQFKKGDIISLGKRRISIPTSNRLIITKITVNETVPFSEPYFSYVEKNAASIKSNVLSSFNAIQSEEVLRQRLEFMKKHIKVYKKNNPRAVVYFEDAHYHSKEVRKLCLETIYPYVDIVSLNEEELAYTLKMYDVPVEIDKIGSCMEGVIFLRKKFSIGLGIIVHTKDYSMYVGKETGADMEKGLMFGNMLATAKALTGWYGTKKEIEEVLKLPCSKKGMEHLEEIKQKNISQVTLVPSKYIDKPKFTIGLGDSFVAGVQICF